ncbi:hypothetical protein BJV82DRAFT_592554 [Fennellomyces sp. T-0311]|nr:hypothetical protein BJV82DRAFT_592554 [Fennellomyces sp. T-0311]
MHYMHMRTYITIYVAIVYLTSFPTFSAMTSSKPEKCQTPREQVADSTNFAENNSGDSEKKKRESLKRSKNSSKRIKKSEKTEEPEKKARSRPKGYRKTKKIIEPEEAEDSDKVKNPKKAEGPEKTIKPKKPKSKKSEKPEKSSKKPEKSSKKSEKSSKKSETSKKPEEPEKVKIGKPVKIKKREEPNMLDKAGNYTNDTAAAEWLLVRHRELEENSHYYVNMQGKVCSNRTGDLEMEELKDGTHHVLVTNKEYRLKLEEIMAYTFCTPDFDPSVHHVFYRDGDTRNCSCGNLVVCDLPILQELEMKRLMTPEVVYVVVRNIHKNWTYEHYLVSNTGLVYSLLERRHVEPVKDVVLRKYDEVILYANLSNRNTERRYGIPDVMLPSFSGRRNTENYAIQHVNGNINDNRLSNLVYFDPFAVKIGMKYRPRPPGKETKWKVIGVIEGLGLSFNRYEVSDEGHVREIGEEEPLPLLTKDGHKLARIWCDERQVEENGLKKTKSYSIDYYVYRLVALAFVPKAEPQFNVIRHLNGYRPDNRAENLIWLPIWANRFRYTYRRPVMVYSMQNSCLRMSFPSIASCRKYFGINPTVRSFNTVMERIIGWRSDAGDLTNTRFVFYEKTTFLKWE